MRRILDTLPPLPRRAGLVLAVRLNALEAVFAAGHPAWKARDEPPSALVRRLRRVALQSRELENAVGETALAPYLMNGIGGILESQGGHAPDAGHQWELTRAGLRLLAAGAEGEAQRLADEIALFSGTPRRKASAEAQLQRLTFQLYSHLHALLPRSLAQIGRSFDPVAGVEGGHLVAFTLAVAEAVRRRRPALSLKPLTEGAIAHSYRRWLPVAGQRVYWNWLRPASAAQPLARFAPKNL